MSVLTANASGDLSNFKLEFDSASDGWFLYGYKDGETSPSFEMWHMSKEDAQEQASNDYGISALDWSGAGDDDETPTRDCNGTVLQNGDTITVIKDLEVKGAGATVKRGTTVKNITLTNDPELIDCRTKDIKGLVLKTCFVKKIND
jgi:protein PhnA